MVHFECIGRDFVKKSEKNLDLFCTIYILLKGNSGSLILVRRGCLESGLQKTSCGERIDLQR